MYDMAAEEVVELAFKRKPELVLHSRNLPSSAEAVRDLLAKSGKLFDRGFPVRVIGRSDGCLPFAVRLTNNNVVCEVHRYCQPVKIGPEGERTQLTLPDRLAGMYLDMVGEWVYRRLPASATRPYFRRRGTSVMPKDTIRRPSYGAVGFPL